MKTYQIHIHIVEFVGVVSKPSSDINGAMNDADILIIISLTELRIVLLELLFGAIFRKKVRW